MRFRDSYRPGPASTIGQTPAGAMPPGGAPSPEELAQPYGAISIPPPGARQRDPRLKRLLWWTVPVAAVLFAAGAMLIALWAWGASSLRAAQGSDWAQARVAYSQQAALTQRFPQPWLGKYNLGTALVDNGELDVGLDRLLEAYEGVPKAVRAEDGTIGPFSYECSVRFNISAALEAQGDEHSGPAEDEAALSLYESALDWVSPCQMQAAGGDGEADPQNDSEDGGDGSGSPAPADEGDGETNEQVSPDSGRAAGEAADRLREKIDRLSEGDSGESSEGAPDDSDTQEGPGAGVGSDHSQENSSSPPETEAERQRREQLEAKNREQAERQREQEESRSRLPGVGGW